MVKIFMIFVKIRSKLDKILYKYYLTDNPAPEDAQYYTCGPPMMTKSLIDMLINIGVERESIYSDDFGG